MTAAGPLCSSTLAAKPATAINGTSFRTVVTTWVQPAVRAPAQLMAVAIQTTATVSSAAKPWVLASTGAKTLK
jgi:hypothetical protein